jgi:RNase H-fold protein (predicted Holliday junction resolvase)
MGKESEFILALDVSTSTIGIALFEDLGGKGKLKLLHHVSPKVKPQPENKMEELFKKVEIFEKEFLTNYADFGITKVVIEEPLLQSNNVYTIATLLRFNGMISKSVYDTVGVVPEFISSYDARKYAFPELMDVRRFKKDGTPLPEKQIAKNQPVLFGGYDFDVDKKYVLWEKVAELEPQVTWFYDKKNKLKKETFDTSDAYVCGIGFMNMIGAWPK